MSDLLVTVDQGTSLSKCLVLDRELRVLGAAARPVARSFPHAGWVEQDPELLFESVLDAIAGAIADAGRRPADVAAVTIANQTETFVVWDRVSGRAVYPAIVWQCRRTDESLHRYRQAGHAEEIRARTGLELDATFPASKLRWLLDNVAGARIGAERGQLLYGDVASWLTWNLSGGRSHVTDATNASRSMLAGLETLAWDSWLLKRFDVPDSMLPEIRPCSGRLADTDPARLGFSAPIVASIGDQQASLFGQCCWREGLAKLTLGSGAFLWANAGAQAPAAGGGLLATCAWSFERNRAYALEGFVSEAGTAVQWLVELGLLDDPRACEHAIRDLPENDSLVCVPAFGGLGSPHWNAKARGSMLGLSHGLGAGEIVRAVLDGVAHQVADVLEAMSPRFPGGLEVIRADGGMSQNDWLLQRVADLTGVTLERGVAGDATARGAAMLGCLALDGWPSWKQLQETWQSERSFRPNLSASRRGELRRRWGRALEATSSWSG